ncbi:MAG: thioredoxin family protein [Bacteroidales bacterium]|nr:thioredoxin family protein [Bacteroidales bacterium]MCF8398418.1 thioredoxin family protein [Bacteroidales bacterium]
MEIKILGSGCAKCQKLEKMTIKALHELNLKADVQKVDDIMQIMNYGVSSTPALVVNGSVRIKGRIPGIDEIKKEITR